MEMSKLEKVIKGLECCSNTGKGRCESSDCPYWIDSICCIDEMQSDALELLKELSSTIGIVQTATSLTFTATGDAKKGEERGLLLGKAEMYETISQALVRRGLMTKEVREVIKGISIR